MTGPPIAEQIQYVTMGVLGDKTYMEGKGLFKSTAS
jgi:hypothetical protein